MTNEELDFIAQLDYGLDAEKHRNALRDVLHAQGASLSEGQYWHPYEVIQLGAYDLTPGHEREFVLCTLLVLNAMDTGFDAAPEIEEKFREMAWVYDKLPENLREVVLAGYTEARAGQS